MSTDLVLTPAASVAAASDVIKAEVRNIVIQGPDTQSLLNAVAVDLEVVPTMDIDSEEMAAELSTSLGRLATVEACIEAERLARGKPLREAQDWLMQGYAPARLTVQNVIGQGRAKLTAWASHKAEEVRKAQETAAAAARERARVAAENEAAALAAANKAAADAQAARAAGSEQVATAMETQAMVAVDQARQSAAAAASQAFARPSVAGKVKSPGVVWKAECTDKAALLAHIGALCAAGDRSLLGLVEIDGKAINALAKLMEGALNVPGLRPYTEERAARISKVAVTT